MDKRTAMVGVLVLLLVGGVSAGLLDYFGRISGEVVVEGPVFYATGYILDNSVNLGEMWVNEPPINSSTLIISNGDFRAFATDSLGINSFYSARYNFTLFAKLDAPDEIIGPQKLKLELFVFNKEWEYKQKVCDTLIKIGKENKEHYAFCEGDAIEMNENDIFYWRVQGLHLNKSVKFSIELNGNTKIEVTAI